MYDLENLNVVIGNSHNEGEESDFVGLTGGPDSPNCENSAERNYYSELLKSLVVVSFIQVRIDIRSLKF